jgi:hypothetical protein
LLRVSLGKARRSRAVAAGDEDIEQAIAADKAASDKKDSAAARSRGEKRRSERGSLPSHLRA